MGFMVNLFGKVVNTRKLQREMNAAVNRVRLSDESQVEQLSALDKDLLKLSITYGEKGSCAFLAEAQEMIVKWKRNLGDDVPSQLYRRIGDILFKEARFPESEKFYQDALDKDPENSDTLVQLSKTFIMQGKFDYAKQALRRAYNVRRNIYTAAVYGEICLLTDEPKAVVNEIVKPYIHEALQKPRLEYAQGLILALNVVTTPDVSKRKVCEGYRQNKFVSPERSFNHVRVTIEQLENPENLMELTRSRESFSKATEDSDLSAAEAAIVKRYRTMNVHWDRVVSSRAISRGAEDAAGTKGFRSKYER